MALLAGKLYDPTVAVAKSTAALLAMTALDTTNLRLSFTVPPSGIVLVRQAGNVSGATATPSILVGVLNVSTVVARFAPMVGLAPSTFTLATALVPFDANFLVTGLTPGATLTWDAAYSVETLVASTAIKYGGPNNATANDAFGGYAFEIWSVD